MRIHAHPAPEPPYPVSTMAEPSSITQSGSPTHDAEAFYTNCLMHGAMPDEAVEEQIPRSFLQVFYTLLLITGISIYVGWGIMYGSWNIFERSNLGIYALSVILIGFGFIGIVLYTLGPKKE
jgi:hypothetical protein